MDVRFEMPDLMRIGGVNDAAMSTDLYPEVATNSCA